MSTAPSANLIKCACCGVDVEEEHTFADPDLGAVCVSFCKGALQWAHAHLRRKTPEGVSITGIHGPREPGVRYDPAISQRELDQLNKEGK